MLYFAYGFNVNLPFLRKFCPSARVLGRAELPNYRVDCTYVSKTYGATADLATSPGDTVWGVLYEIPEDEMLVLDRFQAGDDEAYVRKRFWVLPDTSASSGGKKLLAEVYVVREPGGPFPPSRQYLEAFLEGAKAHGLPSDYLARFEKLLQSATHEEPKG